MSQIYLSSVERSLKPKPKLTISEWADAFRFIPQGTSSEPGRWRTDRAPYSRAIMDALSEPDNRYIVFIAGSQVGKTEIALNVAGYFTDQDPSPIMYLLPTDGVAEDFSKTRLQTMYDNTPKLKVLAGSNSRDSNNTIELKTFPGGYICIHGANAPAKLASRPIRILLLDEIDRYPDALAKEGSPIGLATQRTSNFPNKKIFLISTPTVKDRSAIENWFERSNQQYFYLPCPDCEHEFILEWELIKWELDDKNELIESSVYLQCPACYHKIKDSDKTDMMKCGKWKAHKPDKKIPGFHVSSLYSPWTLFSELVTEYLNATQTKDREKIRMFTNLRLGKSFEEDVSEETDYSVIASHQYEYGSEVPDGVLFITCAVDVQDDRFAIEFCGWGVGEQSWKILYYEVQYDLSSEQAWLELDHHISRSFSFESGEKITATCTVIDSGGHFTQEVYDFCKARQKYKYIYPIKGSSSKMGVPLIGKHSIWGRQQVVGFVLGVDNAKDTLHYRLRNHVRGPGYINFNSEVNAGFNEKYFTMLFSEHKVKVLDKKRGFKWFWEKKSPSVRNEALDCSVYGLAAIRILNPNFALFAAKREEQKAQREHNNINLPTQEKLVESEEQKQTVNTTKTTRTPKKRVLYRHNLE